MSEEPVIIIDNGSGLMKVGFSNEELPSCVFPTVVAKPRQRFETLYEAEMFVGAEAWNLRHHMSFMRPIDHGHIENWEQMEELLAYSFRVAEVEPSNRAVLLTEPPLCSSVHREKLAELMFDVFNVAEINISVQGLMGLYAAGKTTGTVIDIGDGVTQVVPIFDGHTDKGAVKRSDFGGHELTMYLQKVLCDVGYPLTSREDQDIVRQIKEKICFCSSDPAADAQSTELEMEYDLGSGVTLRDGCTDKIALGVERFYAAEALFNPHLCGRDSPPLTDLVWEAIQACPIQARRVLMENVIVCGGSSMFEGFQERLEAELRNTAPPQARSSVKVNHPQHAELMAWVGARAYCNPSLRPLQENVWITREEYDEIGKNIVHQKAALKLT